MILGSETVGKLALAAHETTAPTTTRPPRRTATAKADIVNAPEAR